MLTRATLSNASILTHSLNERPLFNSCARLSLAHNRKTGLSDDPDGKKLDTLLQIQGYFMTPADKAAQTQLLLASDPSLNREKAGGKYYVDGKVASPSKQATDPATAKQLWELSEQMTGIAFDPSA